MLRACDGPGPFGCGRARAVRHVMYKPETHHELAETIRTLLETRDD